MGKLPSPDGPTVSFGSNAAKVAPAGAVIAIRALRPFRPIKRTLMVTPPNSTVRVSPSWNQSTVRQVSTDRPIAGLLGRFSTSAGSTAELDTGVLACLEAAVYFSS